VWRTIRRRRLTWCLALASLLLWVPSASARSTPTIHQFGTAAWDSAAGVSWDGSDLYVCGSTGGTLPGETSLGRDDAFVRKFDDAGNVLWTTQFGSSRIDRVNGCAADASGVYVTGSTNGVFPGQRERGHFDAFLQKVGLDGTLGWARQLGSSKDDVGRGVAAGPLGVGLVGGTVGSFPSHELRGDEDAFAILYSASGRRIWVRQFGADAGDQATAVAFAGRGMYVTGMTSGALERPVGGRRDAFVRRYSLRGSEVWTKQFGSAHQDWATGIAGDGAGILVAGSTAGRLPGQTYAGSVDGFVRRYAPDGSQVWTDEFGSVTNDMPSGVATDGVTISIVGQTDANDTHPEHAVVWRYEADGGSAGHVAFGSEGAADIAKAVAMGGGHTFVAGITYGTLPGQTSAGSTDAFLARV
jgi:hypothetical protein